MTSLAVVEQASPAHFPAAGRGRQHPREYRAARPRRRARRGQGRRPGQGGGARPRRLPRRRPAALADLAEAGAGPSVGQAGDRLRDRLHRRPLPACLAASEIWLNPMGAMRSPAGRHNLYFKGLLDKLGVPPTSIALAPTRPRSSRSPATTCRPKRGRMPRRSAMPCSRPGARTSRAASGPRPGAALCLTDTIGVAKAAGGDIAKAALRAGRQGQRARGYRGAAGRAGGEDERGGRV